MYLYKSNNLLNQQKKRTIQTSLNKNNWHTKSIHIKSIFSYFLTNQQSVDLRIYKTLLRRFKKKLIKRHISVFVLLVPNNKISNKSKNSRMGKGKGMFNRYYCRLLNFKPFLIFKNLNSTRYVKLKKNFLKYFNYKLLLC